MAHVKKCGICKVVALLAGVGALNWGLMTFLGLNLVEKLLGSMPVAAKAVYGLIALSGLVLLLSLFMNCPGCNKGEGGGCCPSK